MPAPDSPWRAQGHPVGKGETGELVRPVAAGRWRSPQKLWITMLLSAHLDV